jgi:hypothetical protein
MSALPPKADIKRGGSLCPLSAISCREQMQHLLDHLVGAGEQRRRHGEAQRSGRLQIKLWSASLVEEPSIGSSRHHGSFVSDRFAGTAWHRT